MLIALALTASLAAAAGGDALTDASQAMEAGRLSQARAMIAAEIAKGAKGARVERMLADLAYASKNHAEAAARYDALIAAGHADAALFERAAISTLKTGALAKAAILSHHATVARDASWRAWNTRGVIADMQNDFAKADDAYGHALNLAPGNPDALNNLGWSYMLRGRWADAIATLETVAAGKTASAKLRNNLELARAAVANDLPRRHPGESDSAFAARLNDAGVAAQVRGDTKRAIAAFAQAIAARTSWYERAANNLKRAEAAQ